MPTDDAVRAFVALGGNLGDRLGTLRSAVRMLAQDNPADTRMTAVSSAYETRPIGPSSEPFLNAVVELRTYCTPRVLLDRLLAIEARHGRERRRRWDARTLDLDLLVVLRRQGEGWVSVDVVEQGLRVPHPQLWQRDFVLVPLAELLGPGQRVDGQEVALGLEAIGEGERTVLRRLDEGLEPGA